MYAYLHVTADAIDNIFFCALPSAKNPRVENLTVQFSSGLHYKSYLGLVTCSCVAYKKLVSSVITFGESFF